tara:strand:- start:12827 stop:13246 length:420 start_codon:yes stop_codon:yes gene_type:complete
MLRDIKEKKSFLLLILIIIFNLSFADSFSVEPEEFLEDKKMEMRARQISKNIRCMICQNQSIDESNATIAKDLRILIREKIKEGYKDKDIYNFLTERYGDFILLKPVFNINTFALWIFPIIFLLIGVFIIFFHNKKSKL